MSTAEIKEAVFKRLEEADDRLLMIVYAMIEAYQQDDDPVISYDVHGRPRRASELQSILDKEVDAVKKGKHITIDELDEKSKQWVKPTR